MTKKEIGYGKKARVENIPHSDRRGFTLIELMVSVTLFIVVMLVSVGALLALVEANRKARALESVMNNLSITLDGMVRAIRMGTEYNCGSANIPDTGTGSDCAVTPGTTFSFAPFGSDPAVQSERWVYSFAGGQLYRSELGGANSMPVTAPEVAISEMKFYVIGTRRRDTTQPKVVVVVKGSAGNTPAIQTSFAIQATAVQRALDL